MMSADRHVLRVLQALLLVLPLFLGGRHPAGVSLGLASVLGLLVWTARERRRRDAAPEPAGVTALAAFVALALLTTLPLPPSVLALLSPETAALYREVLPGWPGGGGWSVWRPLALDPHGAWYELCKVGIGLGAFAVLVAYPWRCELEEDDARQQVFGTLLLTLVAGGAAFALLALLHGLSGSEQVLWLLDPVATPGRVMGPFVNPNHFAAWLEMVIPLGVAYAGAVAALLVRAIRRTASASLAMGVQPRRAWAAALAAHQRRFWLPLVLVAAVLVMVVAHVSTGSRGGSISLLCGLAVVAVGFLRPGREERMRASRLASGAVVAGVLVVALASAVSWSRLEEDAAAGGTADGEVGLVTRLAVGAKGRGIVRDFPLFGAGLGSWVHAFRLYQAPPVEGGIWQHAHNDYLELAAEAGLAGVAIVAWFAASIVRAGRRPRSAPSAAPGRQPYERPPTFAVADWRAALGRRSLLRFGVAGGLAAVLVHSLVDFSLRLPANLLLVATLAAMLVMTRPQRPSRRPTRGVEALGALLGLAAAIVTFGWTRAWTGAEPLAASALVERADRALAEDGDRAAAVALAGRAVDRAPADRSAHEALVVALGRGRDGELALRRAIRLDPWAVELRDWLAGELWRRGDVALAAAELEESIARYPYLVSHAYPEPSDGGVRAASGPWLEALRGSDTLQARLAALAPPLADGVERGLRRALAERPAGATRQRVVEDLVLLLEARGRYREAGVELRAAAGITPDDARRLARAARDFLRAGDAASAEEALVAALELAPEQGELYRQLAVEVFAARGDFGAAEEVLRVAQQNSHDMIPVYRGLTRVLTLREAARFDAAVHHPLSHPLSHPLDAEGGDAAEVQP